MAAKEESQITAFGEHFTESQKVWKRELMGTEFKKIDATSMKAVARRALAELIATGILVFIGCMGLVTGPTSAEPASSAKHFAAVYNFGIAVMVGLICFGHISGAHMNPGLSLTSMILGKLSLPMWIVYTVFQSIGGVIGFALLKAITPDNYMGPKNNNNLCCNMVNPDLNMTQAFFSEFIFSGILSVLACAVWDTRNSDKHDSVTLRFGLGVTALAYGGAQYSGCSMNPARSFGPAVVWNYWDNHWLYWVAPLAANFVVASFYRFVFPEPKKPAPAEDM